MRDLEVVGWRERVALPDLGIDAINAKLDTGARTSALHAWDVELVESGGVEHVRFVVHPDQRSTVRSVTAETPLVEWRVVRSSDGRSERRPVIRTRLAAGRATRVIEITLTRRDAMGFRMLLGRAAIRGRFMVDPGRSYLLGPGKDT